MIDRFIAAVRRKGFFLIILKKFSFDRETGATDLLLLNDSSSFFFFKRKRFVILRNHWSLRPQAVVALQNEWFSEFRGSSAVFAEAAMRIRKRTGCEDGEM